MLDWRHCRHFCAILVIVDSTSVIVARSLKKLCRLICRVQWLFLIYSFLAAVVSYRMISLCGRRASFWFQFRFQDLNWSWMEDRRLLFSKRYTIPQQYICEFDTLDRTWLLTTGSADQPQHLTRKGCRWRVDRFDTLDRIWLLATGFQLPISHII